MISWNKLHFDFLNQSYSSRGFCSGNRGSEKWICALDRCLERCSSIGQVSSSLMKVIFIWICWTELISKEHSRLIRALGISTVDPKSGVTRRKVYADLCAKDSSRCFLNDFLVPLTRIIPTVMFGSKRLNYPLHTATANNGRTLVTYSGFQAFDFKIDIFLMNL